MKPTNDARPQRWLCSSAQEGNKYQGHINENPCLFGFIATSSSCFGKFYILRVNVFFVKSTILVELICKTAGV